MRDNRFVTSGILGMLLGFVSMTGLFSLVVGPAGVYFGTKAMNASGLNTPQRRPTIRTMLDSFWGKKVADQQAHDDWFRGLAGAIWGGVGTLIGVASCIVMAYVWATH